MIALSRTFLLPASWIRRIRGPALRKLNSPKKKDVPLPIDLGVGSDVRVNAVFEDENIYQEDARLLGVQNTGALLPPPRRSIETFADSRFQFRPNSLLPIQGFVAERNAQGGCFISKPASDSEAQYV